MITKRHFIRLIIFSGKNKQLRKKILNMAVKIFSKEQISIHTTLESFSSDLREPGNYYKIILILINTQKDLINILLLKELLNDCNIILILPDTAKETMALGCKLYPRYISYIQSNFKDVKLVLEKMTGNLQQRTKGN